MREEIGILCRNLECVAAGPERSRLSGEALSLLNEPLGQRPLRLLRCGDVLDVLVWFWQNRPTNGLYNLGTGTARTFLDLAQAVFAALDQPPAITFVDTPLDIRDTYQYYTRAELGKLREAGYSADFVPLEVGVRETLPHYP